MWTAPTVTVAKTSRRGAYIFDALKKLKAPLGVYAVMGNHDHWTDAGLVRKELTKLPLSLLDNEGVDLDHGLSVAGVDDFWEGPANTLKAIRNLNPESVIVMLSHNPDVNLQMVEDDRVRLVISGHTHGGQIRIPVINQAPWIPCSWKYRGSSGLHQRNGTPLDLYYKRGGKPSFVPVRLACPPDVGIIRLKRA